MNHGVIINYMTVFNASLATPTTRVGVGNVLSMFMQLPELISSVNMLYLYLYYFLSQYQRSNFDLETYFHILQLKGITECTALCQGQTEEVSQPGRDSADPRRLTGVTSRGIWLDNIRLSCCTQG